MGSKKVGFFLVAAALVAVAGLKMKRSTGNERVLHVFTWSNYLPDAVLADFTKRTGIKIELTYMSSNEELLAKLKAGATGFDVIQPSDYMVRQMMKLGMLSPLDKGQLSNVANLDEPFRELPYDPGNKYSVPFTWGTTGIAVNTAKVKVPGADTNEVGWSALLESPDPRHTSLLDDMREVFAAVLKWRGHSINDTTKQDLEAARSDIGNVKTHILMFSSEPKPLVLRDEINISHIYSCDAAQAHRDNPAIKYFIPKEGGTRWTDNFAIPVSSQHKQDAHAFINFILDPDVAIAIIRDKALATPNRAARLKLSAEEQADPMVYPPREVMERMQFLDEPGDTLQEMNRMWTELKS